MATSSIFTHVKITDPHQARALIDALETSERDSVTATARRRTDIRRTTDPQEIRRLMAQRKKKK